MSYQDQNQDVLKWLAKPGVAFGTFAAATYLLTNAQNTLPIMGMDVQFWMLAGGIGVLSNYVSGIGRDFIFPHLSGGSKFLQTIESSAVELGVSAAIFGFVLPALVPMDGISTIHLAALGAGSQLASNYLYNNIVVPSVI